MLRARGPAAPETDELLRQDDEVTEASRQPIQPPDQHVRDVALVDYREELLQARPVEVLPRTARVLDDSYRSELMKLRVPPQLVRLAGHGEAFLGLRFR